MIAKIALYLPQHLSKHIYLANIGFAIISPFNVSCFCFVNKTWQPITLVCTELVEVFQQHTTCRFSVIVQIQVQIYWHNFVI